MLTAANTGAFRLYCAASVVAEVDEHAERWASEQCLDYSVYRRCWEEQFLPSMRLVCTHELYALLTASERARVDTLADRDDVPSVMLAIALRAFFLSEDRAAHLAVYGFDTDAEERRAWLDVLRSGGDASHLYAMLSSIFLLPALATGGIWNAAAGVRKVSPWYVILGVTAASVWAARVGRNQYARVFTAVRDAVGVIVNEVALPLIENMRIVQAMLPAVPDRVDYGATVSRDSLLTRACLTPLASSRPGPMSVRDLSERLPDLGISQAAPRVGKMLHGNRCFFEPYPGLWQVGRSTVSQRAT
ncbi:MAG: hypothetical protein IAI50_05685 [Candidatus Eremiobacteraeota bacterium]|nr:hypothetical protein [Candidatus Eremiobacteraeota bacterium]